MEMQMNQAKGYESSNFDGGTSLVEKSASPRNIYMEVQNQVLDNEQKIQQILKKFMPSEAISEEDENNYTMSSQPSPKTIDKRKIILL